MKEAENGERGTGAEVPAEAEVETTRDAFHRGRFWLLQPRERGHRAGTDAMVLAAVLPGDFEGRVADLGAGAGAAGFAVAARCPGARVLLVERSPVMAELAARSLGLPENDALRERIGVLRADVTLRGQARALAGLPDNGFDYAILNPPFNDETHRASPDALRREAHVLDGGLGAWLRTAAAIVRPGGGLAAILRPSLLREALDALDGRFGDVAVLGVHPRGGAPAIRVVLRAKRGARGGLALLPPLVLHEDASAAFGARAARVTSGLGALFESEGTSGNE